MVGKWHLIPSSRFVRDPVHTVTADLSGELISDRGTEMKMHMAPR